jgi:hypothetical protein
VEYGVLAAEAADAHTIAREFPASRLLGSGPSLLVSLRDERLSVLIRRKNRLLPGCPSELGRWCGGLRVVV